MMLAAVLPVSWTESGEKAIVPVNEKLTPRDVSRYAYYHVDMEVAKMLGAVDIVRHTNCEYHRCRELACPPVLRLRSRGYVHTHLVI